MFEASYNLKADRSWTENRPQGQKKPDPIIMSAINSKYGQTKTLLKEWNQEEDNILSVVRNNDCSLHAFIKIIYECQMAGSHFTPDLQSRLVSVQIGEEEEDESGHSFFGI